MGEFEESELKDFFDGELKKIVKWKVDCYLQFEQVLMKIGYFIVEFGYEFDFNLNYNMFNWVCLVEIKEDFNELSEQFVCMYFDMSVVCGGVFFVVLVVLRKYFDELFVFIMKCDFELKVVCIVDIFFFIKKVEMVIMIKNMKSI